MPVHTFAKPLMCASGVPKHSWQYPFRRILPYRTSCLAAPVRSIMMLPPSAIPRIGSGDQRDFPRANPARKPHVSKNRTLSEREIATAIGNGISLGLLPRTTEFPAVIQERQHQRKQRVPQPQPAPEQRRALPLKDAAAYLGCTLWRIRSLVWEGKLTAYYEGKRQVIDRADLDAHVEKQKRGA